MNPHDKIRELAQDIMLLMNRLGNDQTNNEQWFCGAVERYLFKARQCEEERLNVSL